MMLVCGDWFKGDPIEQDEDYRILCLWETWGFSYLAPMFSYWEADGGISCDGQNRSQ